jgi:hypothetical protein
MAQQELGQTISCPQWVSWQLHVPLRDLATPRERHLAPIPLSALPRDSSGPASKHRAGPSSRDLPPSPVPVWALLLRTWRPAPSVASTTRSPSGRPHNRIAILQQDPVSLPIYERTHIDLVLLQSIAPLRLAPQRRPQSSLRGHPNRQTLFFSQTGSFRLWLCVLVLPTHSVTHALRIGAGRSMVTIGTWISCS